MSAAQVSALGKVRNLQSYIMRLCVLTAIFVVITAIHGLENSRCHIQKSRHFLDCKSGGLTAVPSAMFHTDKDLLGIDLSFNRIVTIKTQSFVTVSKLQTLDLSNNELKTLGTHAFEGLGNLLSLNMSNNPLSFSAEVFTPQLFQPLSGLKVFRFQGYTGGADDWMWLDRAFGRLKNLTSLFLDFPKEFVFLGGFQALEELTTISTKGKPDFHRESCAWFVLRNRTFEALWSIFVRKLEVIACDIWYIEPGAFDPMTSLEILDLSHNVHLVLHFALLSLYGLIGNNMTTINLALNNVVERESGGIVKEGYFMYLRQICVRDVDLSENYIYLEIPLRNPIQFRLDCLENLNMSYHSFDQWPTPLMAYLRKAPKLKSLDLSRPDQETFARQQGPVKWSHQSSGYGARQIFIPPSLLWLSISGFKISRRESGKLIFTPSPRLRYLGAAFINMKICKVPFLFGLQNLTHLDITGNNCESASRKCFITLRKLTSLKLSDCLNKHGSLASPTLLFSNLRELQEIVLTKTEVTSLYSGLFAENKKLREVNLGDNKLQRLPRAVFHLSKLRKLDLTFNAITHFSDDDMRQLDTWMLHAENEQAFEILLSGNPFQCTCETVLFIRWLIQRKANLDNADNYKCLMSNGTWMTLKRFQLQLADFETKCISHTYLIISVVGTLTFLVLLLLCAVVYRYRLNLRYWLYTKLMPPEKMFVDQKYTYDAFVAYTSHQYEWIIRQLRPKLELVDDPLRLCIHDRDFIPGKAIHENIVDKMKESRKILLIISPEFLESRYGPLEIEYAGMKCLEEGRDGIILCVLMEDIPVRHMPRMLRNLWHKITFLKWSSDPEEQSIFWRNLKAALSQAEQ